MLWALLSMYFLAILFPSPGTKIHLTSLPIYGSHGVPAVMLSFLLFCAGLSVNAAELRNIPSTIKALTLGLAAKVFFPLFFILCFALVGLLWPDAFEIQIIMLSLTVISAMPIAGSSTAWAQSANGSMSMSLGLVLLSTLLSPILTPASFEMIGLIANKSFSKELTRIADTGSHFLLLSVVIPSILGVMLHVVLGKKRIKKISDFFHFLALADLLFLNYCNAAIALPKIFAHPHLAFLVLMFVSTSLLCLSGFYGGWIISKILRISPRDRTSLIFGLGMNNNGTGLVFASTHLPQYPLVMIPIIIYNLEQQILAGIVQAFAVRESKYLTPAPSEST